MWVSKLKKLCMLVRRPWLDPQDDIPLFIQACLDQASLRG